MLLVLTGASQSRNPAIQQSNSQFFHHTNNEQKHQTMVMIKKYRSPLTYHHCHYSTITSNKLLLTAYQPMGLKAIH